MINITCHNKEARTGPCADIGDSNVVAYISFFDTINNTERKLYQPVYGDFKTSTAYLFDLSGNSITLTYADSNKTRTELEDLLVDCCGCVGGDGTVTSFSAGNLSPLFTTNVATPTTTPALSFNLSNCNQYQVFGRVVAGTGAPSYVSLNPIAFNGLAIPSGELVYGTGTSVTSLNKYRVVAGEGIVSGDGIGVAYFGMYAGNGVNEGGALRIKRGSNFVTYIGSDCAAFGGNNDNTTIFAYGNNSVNIATNSVRRLIVDENGYVTINNIPTAASATDILVSNGGVVSTRTVASLGIPVITPSALTKTDDTNVTLTLGGTPATALLEAVSLTLGWTGILAIGRGGTGLGTLGTVNQLLRVNSGGTALEYFSPTWTSNTGTVTSVNASISGALSVSGGPITTSGTLAFSWTGTSGQYVRGDGSLATFPSIPAGTVTSVALALPSNTFDISGSPVTSLGTLTGAFKSQIKKTVLAAPWGADGTPIWRQLQTSDLQQNGATTGQVITWNGTEWAAANPPGGGYWSRSGTVLYTTTSADAVVINTATSNSALARLNVGELGYTAANYQSNIGLHQTDTYGIDKGVSISGYPQAGGPYLGVGKIGFYKENATLNNQDTYFSISTRTGASNVTVDSTKFKISAAGLVTITNIPSSSSSVNLVVSNGGTLESRTIASLAYYTAGTGISIAGPVITNTLPSKWQITGALYLTPSVSAYDIATPITGSIGYVTMRKGTASQCGYFEVRTAAAERVGYIGYQTGYMNYSSEIGNHRFNGGTVQINNIPSGSTSLNILTTNGGVVETRTIASLTGLPSSVWAVQGGSTAATTTTQDIWHNARVRIGDSTVSSFQLSVVGQAYISSGAIINNSVYYSAYASDAVATELLGITSSNLIKVGAPKSGSKSFDIYLPNYTSSRAADTMSAGDSFLFAASSGVMYKQGGQWVRNYGASVFTTADESHIADSTPRRVTFDSYVCNNDYGYFSYSFSSGDYKVAGATGQMFMVICTLEYTTSGTPTVTAQLRVGGATKETNISTSADGRKVMTIHTVTAGGGSGNFEVYLSVSGSAIELKKCRLSVMPLGAECP